MDDVCWNEGDEAVEEEEADEDDHIRGEEGTTQVAVVQERLCGEAKRCAYSSQECGKKNRFAFIIFVLSCNKNLDDDVCDEEHEDEEKHVELEECANQRKAHNSHEGMREDKKHTLQDCNSGALLLKTLSNLEFCHSFRQ